MTDDEIRKIPAHKFAQWPAEDWFKYRWIKLANDTDLEAAAFHSSGIHYTRLHEKIIAEQALRISTAALEAARKSIPSHWKRDRNFLVALLAAVFAIIAAVLAYLAWRFPVAPVAPDVPSIHSKPTPVPKPVLQTTPVPTPVPKAAPAPSAPGAETPASPPDKPTSAVQEQTAPAPSSKP